MEKNRSKRNNLATGIILADLDHFKKVNDFYGHPVGDAVLIETARRLRNNLRASDAAGRYGGEEFIAILPDVDLDLATKIAERIRLSMAEEPFITPKGNIQVTISLGVGIIPPDKDIKLSSVIAQVDRALYQAKEDGRNCVRTCRIE
jgi:two-component system cell cycle response regulator